MFKYIRNNMSNKNSKTFPPLDDKDKSFLDSDDELRVSRQSSDVSTSSSTVSSIRPPQSLPPKSTKRGTQEAKAMSSVNEALSSTLSEEDKKRKDAFAEENYRSAVNKPFLEGEPDIFDTKNHAVKRDDLRSYNGLTRTEQEQLLQASDEHQPASEYGKKSKKFRMLPSSFFGKTAAVLAIGLGVVVAMASYNGAKIHEKLHGGQTVAVATSADIINKDGKDTIVTQSLNLKKIPDSSYEVRQVKSLKISQFNDILLYMDKTAMQSLGDSTQNYHMIQYGIEKGQISPKDGLKLLAESKNTHEQFLKNIQSDKDEIIIFFQKAQKGQDVFYKNNDTQSLADAALGRASASKNFSKTPFEKFQFWDHNSTNVSSYKDDANNEIRHKINVALGPLSSSAQSHSFVQMSTGVKTNYKSILLDQAGNAKELSNPNTDIDKTKSVPEIISTYQAQNPIFNNNIRKQQIQGAKDYDALAQKALEMADKFNQQAIENSQVSQNRNKP